ncbi:Membrane protein involved in the export of O-antigen and teichoic acid [Polaribacter sp. KT25b]|uniref:oligosaccharide flippase family protein n=1 Tax=Polaribacter sp. KT25b TaxID=1855336 RepID=UPI00087920F7|nr:oligosaccharide flippase family protein [Polaribacter sp. KT25b]SDR73133.1 Membrane protein involved in the export of O-antigen and teichoic acid [Polaribacter sp. KT25b]
MQLFSFLKKEFVKNVLTLITGSALSQVVIYASILILTRLFSTELFGIYTLFSSATLILKPLATLQYEFAIVLPKRDKDAINLAAFSFIILAIYCLLLLIIIFFFNESIANFFNITKLANFIYLLPLSVFLFASVSIFDYWNNRTSMFKNISKGLLAKSATMSSAQLATGFSSFNSLGLIPGMLLGQCMQLLFLIKASAKTMQKLIKNLSLKRMFFLAKRYKDIPVFNTIINLTNNLSNELPVLLITKYFGLASSGIYGLAIKFMRAPVGIFQQSINQVFFNKASKIYNEKGDLHDLVIKTAKHLLFISSFLFIPLFVISFFLDIIFGENWADVGLYSRIIIPWLFFAFLSNPITPLILILNKQKTMVIYDSFLLIFRFLALFLGYYFYDNIVISLILFSGVGMLFNILIFIYLLKTSKEKKIAYS